MEYFGLCKGIKNLKLPNVNEMGIYEGLFADFYDKCCTEKFDYDIYFELADTYGRNILELGCGSGRVALPLLERGLNVTGVDLSQDMLDILEQRSMNMENKPKLCCDDMCKFVSEEKYDVIILAHTTLCLLKNQSERVELFNNVYRNLREGGVFVFNYLDTDFENMKIGEKKPKYFFNPLKKSFMIFMEKVIEDKMKSVVNIYSEEVDDMGNVSRYLTSTTKYTLNKSMIADIVNKMKFTKEKEYGFNILDGIMKFEVIKKCY